MIADIIIEPVTGELDVAKLESHLTSLPLIAPAPSAGDTWHIVHVGREGELLLTAQ